MRLARACAVLGIAVLVLAFAIPVRAQNVHEVEIKGVILSVDPAGRGFVLARSRRGDARRWLVRVSDQTQIQIANNDDDHEDEINLAVGDLVSDRGRALGARRLLAKQVTIEARGAGQPIVSPPVPVHPPGAPGFYGSGLGADGLNNLRLGGAYYDPPYRVKVSWRFRARHTGLLQSVRPYYIKAIPGYASGNGGTVLVQLQTDDGTANHFPSGTVLASFLDTHPMGGVGPYYTFPILPFSTPLPSLTAGVLYHLVFSNTAADPLNNWISLDTLYLDIPTLPVPRQPTVSDVDMYTLVNENGVGWSTGPVGSPGGGRGDGFPAGSSTPVLDLTYAGGFHQGYPPVGYVEVWDEFSISGVNQLRETFTVSGPTRKVSTVSLRAARVSGSDPLTIRLETAAGVLIEQGVIPASVFPLRSLPLTTLDWATYTFTTPRTLTSGQGYNLVLRAPSTSTYGTFPMRKAADYLFHPATYFADGHVQQNTGSGWVDFVPQSWGTNRPDGDLQFYFTVVR